jgi:hypothetical protein
VPACLPATHHPGLLFLPLAHVSSAVPSSPALGSNNLRTPVVLLWLLRRASVPGAMVAPFRHRTRSFGIEVIEIAVRMVQNHAKLTPFGTLIGGGPSVRCCPPTGAFGNYRL